MAFPLISSGVYGYPKAQSIQVAVEAIEAFLQKNDMTVYLVTFFGDRFELDDALRKDLEALPAAAGATLPAPNRRRIRPGRWARRCCKRSPGAN